MRAPPGLLLVAVPLLFSCGGATAPAHVAAPAPPSQSPSPAPAAAPTAGAAPVVPMLTAPPPPLGADHVTFTLYKFMNPVGAERDTFVALPDGGTEAKAVFSYRDRRATVPLAARFAFGRDGSLTEYAAWGRTSRFTEIDDHARAEPGGFATWSQNGVTSHVRPSGLAVPGPGYAPMLAQDLMLRAWNEHGRPASMALLPTGTVTIESRGKETYDGPAGKVTLEHVALGGVVWGREDAWLDADGKLAAVVTRDAEFDHHEAARDGFDGVLAQLTKAAGADGVKWLASAAKGAARDAGGVLALVGGNVIDGTGRAPIEDAVVVVDGDRIVAVGPRASTTIPPGATTLDVHGESILPGLWDMHAHVQQVEQGAVYLAAGVTTVRDMGNILDFITGIRDALDAGNGLGPRVLVEGLVDGTGEGALGTVRITKREEIAPTIDRLKKAGCIDVKIYSSVDPSLVKPIVAYAHAHGMRAVGHVPTGMTSQQAIDAGYDSISHIAYLFDAALGEKDLKGLSRAQSLDKHGAVDLASPPMAHLFDSLVRRHVVLDDTIALEEQILHTTEEDGKREPGIAKLPRELAATIGGVPPTLAPHAEAEFAKMMAMITELHKRGGTLVAGTDITVPGHSLHRELELYVQAGFTPMEAIQAATIVPARFMHRDKELGTIERGKRADLVVVRGDPLANIGDVRKTTLVVSRGHAFDTGELWKVAGFTP